MKAKINFDGKRAFLINPYPRLVQNKNTENQDNFMLGGFTTNPLWKEWNDKYGDPPESETYLNTGMGDILNYIVGEFKEVEYEKALEIWIMVFKEGLPIANQVLDIQNSQARFVPEKIYPVEKLENMEIWLKEL